MKKGFSLIETIIAIGIISIILSSSITLNKFKNTKNLDIRNKDLIQNISDFLVCSSLQSIKDKNLTSIFYDSNKREIILNESNKEISKVKILDGYDISINSNGKDKIFVNSNGEFINSGSILLQKQGKYIAKFSIGVRLFHVEYLKI